MTEEIEICERCGLSTKDCDWIIEACLRIGDMKGISAKLAVKTYRPILEARMEARAARRGALK